MNSNILPVSILIPTMNRAESLKNTVLSLVSADYIPKEIVIVDQTPDESLRAKTKEFLSSVEEIDIKYFYQAQPSTTVSRNKAADEATQPILVYSDDDIEVFPDTLYMLCKRFEDDHIALISVCNEAAKHNKPSFRSRLFELASNGVSYSKRKKGHVTASLLGCFPEGLNGEADTEWAMGYFFAVRRQLATDWGIVWDTKLSGYAYAEDLDYSMAYCRRASECGYRCIVTNSILVRHLCSPENRQTTKKMVCIYVLNRLYLSYKYNLGVFCRLAIHWRNLLLGILLSLKKRWKLSDLCYAYRLYFKYKKDIKQGRIADVYDKI